MPTNFASQDAIRVVNVHASYDGFEALTGASFRVPAGQTFGLLGLNGAGKTTLLRVLAGLHEPDRGEATVLGTLQPRDMPRRPDVLGVVFSENWLPEPEMSAVRYLRHFASLLGLSAQDGERRVRELCVLLRLSDFAEQPMKTLSGGNRRKLEIARALLPSPRILLLDEPTKEFDIPAKRALWEFLNQLSSTNGTTVVISSHDVQEIAALCRRVAVLVRGRVHFEGELPPNADLTGALAHMLEGSPQAHR